jgi:hypothetical protein
VANLVFVVGDFLFFLAVFVIFERPNFTLTSEFFDWISGVGFFEFFL